jgi:outer membrane lipoprotein-sorting protein
MTATLSLRRRLAQRLIPAALALALAAGTTLSGCSTVSPPAGAQAEATTSDLSQLQQSAQALAERAGRLDAMQSDALMEYEGRGHHLKVHEEIAIKRPGSLRVEALSPFGVAAVVAAHDSTLAIYQTSNNTFYHGAATADTLNRFAQIPLPPDQAIKLLMGLPPNDDSNLASPTSVRTENGMLIGTYQHPGGVKDELGFEDGQLRLVRAEGPDGPIYEVHYSDYHDSGGMPIAHRVEANFLNTGTRLTVRYSSVTINPPLDNSEFVLVPQGAAKQVDLDQAVAAGGNG